MSSTLHHLAALLGILLGVAWATQTEPPTVLELVWIEEQGCWWECRR